MKVSMFLYPLLQETRKKSTAKRKGEKKEMMTIVGKRKADYVSKKDGERKIGANLFCVCDGGNDVEGKSVESLYISDKNAHYDFAKDVAIGSVIRVTYNRYGSVADIMLEQSPKEAAK